MDKAQLNVRISQELADKLDQESNDTGRSKTWIVTAAVSDYLGIPHEAKDIESLHERVKALEAKFEKLAQNKGNQRSQNVKKEDPEPDNQEKINANELGKLITIKEAAQLTGYAVGTLRSKLSRVAISAQDRVSGNRAGLYSKKQILDRIGMK